MSDKPDPQPTADEFTNQLGYETLEAFIAKFGEVDEFFNINQAIKAFLGVDND